MLKKHLLLLVSVLLPACDNGVSGPPANDTFTATPLADFETPWALEFLPDGRLLVTELAGQLKLFAPSTGELAEITGVPTVAHAGQGGLSDVVLHPDFEANRLIYLSYAEAGEEGLRGAAVARATLVLDADGLGGALTDLEVVWRQIPKVADDGHYAHRIAFGDGYLWISSGDRRQFTPAQDLGTNLGKVVRLNADGSLPEQNPFAGQGEIAAQVWTLGHRNPLGLAFDGSGRLWSVEMGPSGGDELNLLERGGNYGYPVVSNGDHYDGTAIPDHSTRPDLNAPAVSWNPVISPSSLLFYDGAAFPEWQGKALIGGLSSEALVVIEFDGAGAREERRYDMGMRIRDVEQGPDGAVWVLEDGRRSGQGRLFRLAPVPRDAS